MEEHAKSVVRRPAGASDETVAATGKLSEAFEWIQRATGRLYDFHQMIGHADFLLEDAADALAGAGHADLARFLREEIIGRNVIHGRWTFQLVDEFEDVYAGPLRDFEGRVRNELLDGRRHVYEAEMKEQRRTAGRDGHERSPSS
jgi:hypothetical protein